jgi:arylsulfatase A-like enzyme
LHVPSVPPQALWPAAESLAEALPHAELIRDTTEIDLGRPLPRGTLVRGWSWPERWAGGGGGGWANELQAEIAFPLVVAGPRRFLAWMASAPGAAVQPAEVRINGLPVARLLLGPKLEEHAFSVPAEALRPGQNRLVLAFERLDALPHGRRAAAVLDKILIKPGSDELQRRLRPVQAELADVEVQSRAETSGWSSILLQPGDTWLEIALLPRLGAELHFFRYQPSGSERAVASSSVEACHDTPDGESCRQLVSLPVWRPEPQAWAQERLPLPELERAAVRLRLRVEGSAEDQSWPGQVWGEPLVRSRTPPPPFRLAPAAIARGAVADRAPGLPRVRHVLLYLIDTLRADALLEPAHDAPHLRRLLRHSLWAAEARSPASWTRPAVASLMTSSEPAVHGATGRGSRLRPGTWTLAGWLEQHAVACGAVVANGNVAAELGFAAGFRSYRHVYAPAPAVHAAALEWLRQLDPLLPSFTYVHVIDPHDPYAPSPPWSHLPQPYAGPLDGRHETLKRLASGGLRADEADRRHLRELYQAEIRQLDAAFGDLLAALAEMGRLEETAIVLLSDHGEEFGEHGAWLHGNNLGPEQTRVPLALWLPRGAGRLLPGPATLLDVAPSVCELLGVPVPAGLAGHVLTAPAARGPVPLELDLDGREHVGAVGPDWAYSFSLQNNHAPQLHAPLADPGHRRNLAGTLPVTAAALEQWLLARRARLAQPPAPPVASEDLEPETLDQLRRLGYLAP